MENIIIEQNGVWFNVNNLPQGMLLEGEIDLSGYKLKELPEKLTKAVILGSLDLSNNCLEKLPRNNFPKFVYGCVNICHNRIHGLKRLSSRIGGKLIRVPEEEKSENLQAKQQASGIYQNILEGMF